MTRYVKTPISSGFSQGIINQELQEIQAAINDTLSRVGDQPNQMETDLDMNSNDVINVNNIDTQSLAINGHQVVANETFVTPLPDPTGQDGKFIRSNGTSASWQNITAIDVDDVAPIRVTTVAAMKALTGLADNALVQPLGFYVVGDFPCRPRRFSLGSALTAVPGIIEDADDASGQFILDNDGWMHIEEFGCLPDATDRSTEMQAAMDWAETDNGLLCAGLGTFLVKDITQRRDVMLWCGSKEGTIFKAPDGSTPSYIIKGDGPRCMIANCIINGNDTAATTAVGIDWNQAASPGSFFNKLWNVEIQRCTLGLDVSNANMAEITSVSFNRCLTACKVQRSRPFIMNGVDMGKFTVAGLYVLGSTAGVNVIWTGGFTETVESGGSYIPAANAPHVLMESLRLEDFVHIKGVWMNGHAASNGYTTVGYELRDPVYADNIKFDGVTMYDFAAPALYTGVASTEVGYNDMRGVRRAGGTPAWTRQIGVLTENSYEFSFMTDAITLTGTGANNLIPIPMSGPIEIKEFSMMVTTAFSSAGNGALRFGDDVSTNRFATGLVLTNGDAVGTVRDFTSLLTARSTNTAFVRLRLNADTALTVTGAAKFKIRGIVY